MNDQVFTMLRELIYRESGIALTEEKRALLSSRLYKRLRALGLRDEIEYVETLRKDTSGTEVINLIDVVSTNFTSFFREPEHFEILSTLADKWANERRSQVRIWCAASSTGEEPYTIAMTFKERKGNPIDFKLLATDISTKVLNKALHGEFPNKQVLPLPVSLRNKYFTKIRSEEPEWKISQELCDSVLFRRLNLSQFPYPLRGDLDAIFCRNVMIYFNLDLRAKIVSELHRLLRPGGYLFLSHCENLLGIKHHFKSYSSSVYVRA